MTRLAVSAPLSHGLTALIEVCAPRIRIGDSPLGDAILSKPMPRDGSLAVGAGS